MAKSHAMRQAEYRARQGWVGKRKNRDRMREARKGPCVTIAPPVRDVPVRDVPHYGEIEYGPVEGWDVMEPEEKGGQREVEVEME